MAYSPIIKLCGIKTSEALDVAIEAGADMVGFMHFPRSARHADIDTIGRLISEARGRIESVVVLVNPDNSMVAEIAALDPDWIQLHGPETPHRVETVRAEAGLNIMKVVGVAEKPDLDIVPEFAGVADRLLLETKAPKNTDMPGGRGVLFDWTILEALDPDIQFMLSGGLTPENVAQAVTQVQPYGLDVSSGVEVVRGEKDFDRMRAFVANARDAAAKL